MDRKKLLNPQVDSIGALQLSMCVMLVASTHGISAEEREKHSSVVIKLYVPKLIEVWVQKFGKEALSSEEFDYDSFHETLEALVAESNESEDYEILVEHIFSLIQNEDLRLLTISLMYGLAAIDNDFGDEEVAVIYVAAQLWGVDMAEISNPESRYMALNKEYNLIELLVADHSKEGQSSCFIATAVLEDPEHPSLVSLRCFRDTFLLNNCVGKDFVNWYYKNGPQAAAYISKRPSLKFFVKYFAVIPLSVMSYIAIKIIKI